MSSMSCAGVALLAEGFGVGLEIFSLPGKGWGRVGGIGLGGKLVMILRTAGQSGRFGAKNLGRLLL